MLFLFFIVLFNCCFSISGTSLNYSQCIKSSWNRGSRGHNFFPLEFRQGVDLVFSHSKICFNKGFQYGPGDQNSCRDYHFTSHIDIKGISSKSVAHRERYDTDTLNVSNQYTCQTEKEKAFANVHRQASTTHTVTDISDRNTQSSPDWSFLKHPLGSAGIHNPYYCIVKGSSSYKRQQQLQIANAPCHLKHLIRLHAALGMIIQHNTMALRLRAEDKQRLTDTLQQNRLPLDYSFAAERSTCEGLLKDTTHNGQAVKITSSGHRKTSHAQGQTLQPRSSAGWTGLFTGYWSLILATLLTAGLTTLTILLLPYIQTVTHRLTHQPFCQNTYTQRMYDSQHLSEDMETAIRLLTSWENQHVPLYRISDTDLKENGGL
ncbi:uncharacterized protein [Narcine bancroftii]|uniref:uncharacterized protein n=1 Tax=Narcine bancroftii TaxID=1343680 RepID=UPI003832060F